MRLMATIQLDRTGLEYDHICCFIGRAAKNDGKRKGAETNTVWWDSELVTASRENIPVTWDIPGCATCQCCGNSPSRGGSKMPWSAGFFPSSPSIPHSVIIPPPFWAVLGKQGFISSGKWGRSQSVGRFGPKCWSSCCMSGHGGGQANARTSVGEDWVTWGIRRWD